jgi:hypothetical protein
MSNSSQARNNTRRLFQEQGGTCFYCNTEMYLMENSTKKYRKKHRSTLATFDHINLNSNGGTYAYANGVCACFKCNGMRGNLEQGLFIRNFELIAAEWEKGNRTPMVRDGNLITCIPSKKYKRVKKKRKQQTKNLARAGFIIARYAMHIGKTVEDLFLENVYNSTYELVRDL